MKVRILFACALLILPQAILFAQKQSFSVAVVGGGMAGISAAYHIHKQHPDAQITVFEKEAVLGGNARTVQVENANKQLVSVDAGPQYFTEGPWDEYIQFLQENEVYEPSKTSAFVGSICIQNEARKKPVLVTPLNGSFRGESLGKLLRLKRFFDEAFDVYQNPTGTHEKAIGSWVKKMDADLEFKQQVILPFLAASLGTSVDEIMQTSTVDIVKLFAFRKPSNKGTFKVMHDGMGTLIKRIGERLQQQAIEIVCSAPVSQVNTLGNKYTVVYQQNDQVLEKQVDFVVMAVHADQANKLVKDEGRFAGLARILKQFHYFKARIVLHTDSKLVNQEKPAFLNVLTTMHNQIAANTMNLGMIDERYKGLYKSWLTEELANKLKLNGHFLHEEIFWHPLITPEFNASLAELERELSAWPGLSFAGGWTQGLETQETAVVSGKKAAEKFDAFLQKASN